jgi:drug/metabolite transporter (DMT)-like permease
MDTKTPNRLVLIAFAITVLLGGNNAIAVRYSNAELPPFFGAAIRFSLAAVIMFFLVLILRLPLPRGRSLQGAMIFGILSIGLNYALVYWALEYIPAGLNMVILALTPLLTFLFAWAHGQEKFRWQALFGAFIALAGISVIAWSQLSAKAPMIPILAVALAAACFAEASVLVKTFPKTHPITTNAVALLTGSVLLFIMSALFRETPTLPTRPATWIALIYLIILGSVAVFALNLFVLKNWTASASSYLFVLMPIVTVSVATWLANESVTLPFLIGGAFVLSGAYIGSIANVELWRCTLVDILRRFRTPVPACE